MAAGFKRKLRTLQSHESFEALQRSSDIAKDNEALNVRVTKFNEFLYINSNLIFLAIALNILEFFHRGRLDAIERDKDQIAREILFKSWNDYADIKKNNPQALDRFGHIEISSLGTLNEAHEMVRDLSANSRIVLETGETIVRRFEMGGEVTMQNYFQGLPTDTFSHIFYSKGCKSWTNFALCRRGLQGGHYVTAFLATNGTWILVNAIGSFAFYFFPLFSFRFIASHL
jgi:hypothetical protein